MQKTTLLLAAMATAIVSTDAVSHAQATEVVWGGTTGIRTWQDNGNWVGGAFPNDSLKIANLSVNLDADLTVHFGASNITVAGVKLGGTSAAVTTSVASSGGILMFSNGLSAGGTPTIESTGVAGSVNLLSAPIHLANQQLEIVGPTNLSMGGNITYHGGLKQVRATRR